MKKGGRRGGALKSQSSSFSGQKVNSAIDLFFRTLPFFSSQFAAFSSDTLENRDLAKKMYAKWRKLRRLPEQGPRGMER